LKKESSFSLDPELDNELFFLIIDVRDAAARDREERRQ
jgi:hypothetical protein